MVNFLYLKKKTFVAFVPICLTRYQKFEKEKHYLYMRAIQNQKFYTYLGGSSRVCDFFKFGRYAFTLKTLTPSQHSE
jgi:hypothetical protein